ncbi:MAG: 2-isopropylmalate synthase [Candidatus Goldbacteria bacterium]|nr:2-isopropylmalate synthase [Candidatus Goldiibacteriota bacterium]
MKITILDTTLRDGEQSPGMALALEDKLSIALMLEAAGVDIIEAGFPAASESDFEAVKIIAGAVKNSAVCAFARVLEKDIEKAAGAVKQAVKKHIHLSIATSPIHRQNKLKMSREEVIKKAVDAVLFAKTMCDTVEIGAEDATRTEPEFLCDFFSAVTEAGAVTINIADTAGYALPGTFAGLTAYILKNVPKAASGEAVISVHCHNDLGLALINTLAGISAGAAQAEVTLMGIGERAGNAALEEMAAVLKVRKDVFSGFQTGINNKILIPACEMLSSIEGIVPGITKPLFGRNSFSHSSGMHQDGMLKNKQAYEIINPADFGGGETEILLSRHSGRKGVSLIIEELIGILPMQGDMAKVMAAFEAASKREKTVSFTELLYILRDKGLYDGVLYSILKVSVEKSRKKGRFSARVDLKVNEANCHGFIGEDDNPFKALFMALDSAMPWGIVIKNYSYGMFGSEDKLSASAVIKAKAVGKTVRAESYNCDIYRAIAGAYADIANYSAAISKKYSYDVPENIKEEGIVYGI